MSREIVPNSDELKEMYPTREDEDMVQYFHRIIFESKHFALPGSPGIEDSIRYLLYKATKLSEKVADYKRSIKKLKANNKSSDESDLAVFSGGYANGWYNGIEYYKKVRDAIEGVPEEPSALGSSELAAYGEGLIQQCIKSYENWKNKVVLTCGCQIEQIFKAETVDEDEEW